jgi:ADP-heptose:LPS heptosyltransferase
VHWPQALGDFDDMAALVLAVDVVITVCGSVVHLSGALGKTAWVLVPACPEWRYLDSGDRMPWYSSVKMFRQTVPNDWHEPLAAVAAQLAAMPRNA